MTFKELQKLIHYRQSESSLHQTRFFNRLKDKPFWIWNEDEHRRILAEKWFCINKYVKANA